MRVCAEEGGEELRKEAGLGTHMPENIATELDGGAVDSLVDDSLDALDRRILGVIQSGFPLEPAGGIHSL